MCCSCCKSRQALHLTVTNSLKKLTLYYGNGDLISAQLSQAVFWDRVLSQRELDLVWCEILHGHHSQCISQREIQFGHGFMTVAQKSNSAELCLCAASDRSLDLKKGITS